MGLGTQKYLGNKALSEYDTFDPIRNLWRNVLIVAISDAIKVKQNIVKFSEFYKNKSFYELDKVPTTVIYFDEVRRGKTKEKVGVFN